MLEFHNKNITKIAIIYGDKYYYNSYYNNHLQLLESIIDIEFMTNEMYKNFIHKYNPIFIYFFPNDYIVFSSFEKVPAIKIIQILEQNNIPIIKLYRKHEFNNLIDYSTFSKINILKINNEVDK